MKPYLLFIFFFPTPDILIEILTKFTTLQMQIIGKSDLSTEYQTRLKI